MVQPTPRSLQEYVAHCATCGQKIKFREVPQEGLEGMQGACDKGHKWWFCFDIDKSGTFGVMSFQCDNGDRVMDE